MASRRSPSPNNNADTPRFSKAERKARRKAARMARGSLSPVPEQQGGVVAANPPAVPDTQQHAVAEDRAAEPSGIYQPEVTPAEAAPVPSGTQQQTAATGTATEPTEQPPPKGKQKAAAKPAEGDAEKPKKHRHRPEQWTPYGYHRATKEDNAAANILMSTASEQGMTEAEATPLAQPWRRKGVLEARVPSRFLDPQSNTGLEMPAPGWEKRLQEKEDREQRRSDRLLNEGISLEQQDEEEAAEIARMMDEDADLKSKLTALADAALIDEAANAAIADANKKAAVKEVGNKVVLCTAIESGTQPDVAMDDAQGETVEKQAGAQPKPAPETAAKADDGSESRESHPEDSHSDALSSVPSNNTDLDDDEFSPPPRPKVSAGRKARGVMIIKGVNPKSTSEQPKSKRAKTIHKRAKANNIPNKDSTPETTPATAAAEASTGPSTRTAMAKPQSEESTAQSEKAKSKKYQSTKLAASFKSWRDAYNFKPAKNETYEGLNYNDCLKLCGFRGLDGREDFAAIKDRLRRDDAGTLTPAEIAFMKGQGGQIKIRRANQALRKEGGVTDTRWKRKQRHQEEDAADAGESGVKDAGEQAKQESSGAKKASSKANGKKKEMATEKTTGQPVAEATKAAQGGEATAAPTAAPTTGQNNSMLARSNAAKARAAKAAKEGAYGVKQAKSEDVHETKPKYAAEPENTAEAQGELDGESTADEALEERVEDKALDDIVNFYNSDQYLDGTILEEDFVKLPPGTATLTFKNAAADTTIAPAPALAMASDAGNSKPPAPAKVRKHRTAEEKQAHKARKEERRRRKEAARAASEQSQQTPPVETEPAVEEEAEEAGEYTTTTPIVSYVPRPPRYTGSFGSAGTPSRLPMPSRLPVMRRSVGPNITTTPGDNRSVVAIPPADTRSVVAIPPPAPSTSRANVMVDPLDTRSVIAIAPSASSTTQPNTIHTPDAAPAASQDNTKGKKRKAEDDVEVETEPAQAAERPKAKPGKKRRVTPEETQPTKAADQTNTAAPAIATAPANVASSANVIASTNAATATNVAEQTEASAQVTEAKPKNEKKRKASDENEEEGETEEPKVRKIKKAKRPQKEE